MDERNESQRATAVKSKRFSTKNRLQCGAVGQNELRQAFLHSLRISDEAHVTLAVLLTNNCRYWSRGNPHQLHERPLYSQKVTLWCAISSVGIIGPCFFEDDQGRTITVTCQCEVVLKILQSTLSPLEMRMPLETSPTAESFITKIPTKHCWFGRGGLIGWPARSPDVTHCMGTLEEPCVRDSNLNRRTGSSLGYLQLRMLCSTCLESLNVYDRQ
ncbi:hypothetical protein ANN_06493 [Periplaneta americana]|uniref:Uncharacterized protein n=1 Tax=Periplaneta americana TaxID=6978 RepID=A0ABQ8TEY3_PERAM|nr:hypothetical protein ANN_06493 [Periplaneta americana]